MRSATVLCTSLILLVSCVLLLPSAAGASEEIALAEGGLACTSCHDKPGSKLYTDRGKYYEVVGTLEGYDEVVEAFRACTNCHVSEPGSGELTEQGQLMQQAIGDMEALRQWLLSSHAPALPVSEPLPGNEAEAEDEPGEAAPVSKAAAGPNPIVTDAASVLARSEDEARLARGRLSFRIHCQNCHGDQGLGDGPMLEDLSIKPSNLTTLAQREPTGDFPEEYVYRVIDGREPMRGHGMREMPVWGHTFQLRAAGTLEELEVADRILDLIAFLKSIQVPEAKTD